MTHFDFASAPTMVDLCAFRSAAISEKRFDRIELEQLTQRLRDGEKLRQKHRIEVWPACDDRPSNSDKSDVRACFESRV
jgi:hypothetical protein